jgi:hypothetical protein
MGRLTAAAAVTIIFSLMGNEAWEIGTRLPYLVLLTGAVLSIFISTYFIYYGKNLSEIAREYGWHEQLTRTRIVLYNTLLSGMACLWVVLFGVSLGVVVIIPPDVSAGWVGHGLGYPDLVRHAMFMATLGVFAAALGGNLEEENDFKARLFYDEEI